MYFEFPVHYYIYIMQSCCTENKMHSNYRVHSQQSEILQVIIDRGTMVGF